MTETVFNCTPDFPYTVDNLAIFIEALGRLQAGTSLIVEVFHDSDPEVACSNCGHDSDTAPRTMELLDAMP